MEEPRFRSWASEIMAKLKFATSEDQEHNLLSVALRVVYDQGQKDLRAQTVKQVLE